MDSRTSKLDLMIAVLLGGVAFAAVHVLAAPNGRPFEDAAMLLRYADHLARGHGIVWNVGEPPIDGATDFLFMVGVAALQKVGMGPAAAAWHLIAYSHVLSVPLLYLGSRLLYQGRRELLIFASLYLALGPGLPLCAAYFGTPTFVLVTLVTFLLAWAISDGRTGLLGEAGFGVSCLLLGLIRPEGVLLGGFMLLGILVFRLPQIPKRLLAWYLGIMCVLGGTYFVWRWTYFGYPLPNPFYRKGGGKLYVWGLTTAIKNVLELNWPFLAVSLMALFSPRLQRRATMVLLPAVGFTVIWVLLSDEMNYAGRFQLAVLPILLVGAPYFTQELLRTVGSPSPTRAWRRHLPTIAVGLGAIAVLYVLRKTYPARPGAEVGLREAAKILQPYRDKGYYLVSSEAGLLPFMSGWKSIDPWGLNDAWIAHNRGIITEEYLDRYSPEVVMFHGYSSPFTEDRGEEGGLAHWGDMVKTLKSYVRTRDYVLAGSFGTSAFDTHWYYIKRDFPESARLSNALAKMEYGGLLNFASDPFTCALNEVRVE